MVRTITPEQTISTTREELKKRKLNPSVCEPSDETIQNILNYSKALKAVSSSNTGVIMNVLN
jgi:hypothetical protein